MTERIIVTERITDFRNRMSLSVIIRYNKIQIKEDKSMAMVNIKGLDKAEVLWALWKSSRMQGMSFLGFLATGELTLEQAEKEVEERLNASAVCGERRCYFDYLNGRVLKVDISQDEFDSRLYERVYFGEWRQRARS